MTILQQPARWLYEKNMPRQPFMEAIIYDPINANRFWTIAPALCSVYQNSKFQIAPRVEVSLDPRQLGAHQSGYPEVGQIMLGTWTEELKRFLKENEPYRTQLKPSGNRNFHREKVFLDDLPFDRMAERLRHMLTQFFLSRN